MQSLTWLIFPAFVSSDNELSGRRNRHLEQIAKRMRLSMWKEWSVNRLADWWVTPAQLSPAMRRHPSSWHCAAESTTWAKEAAADPCVPSGKAIPKPENRSLSPQVSVLPPNETFTLNHYDWVALSLLPLRLWTVILSEQDALTWPPIAGKFIEPQRTT